MHSSYPGRVLGLSIACLDQRWADVHTPVGFCSSVLRQWMPSASTHVTMPSAPSCSLSYERCTFRGGRHRAFYLPETFFFGTSLGWCFHSVFPASMFFILSSPSLQPPYLCDVLCVFMARSEVSVTPETRMSGSYT